MPTGVTAASLPAAHHGVRPPQADGVKGRADGVGRGRAGGDRAAVVAQQLPLHGDLARGHVGDHHGHHVRVDPFGAPVDQDADAVLQGADAPDARGVDDAGAFGGGGDVELGASIASLVATRANWTTRSRCRARRRPKKAAASKPGTSAAIRTAEPCGVKGGDRPHPAPTGNERLPGLFDVQAERADHPHAGHDHSAVVHSPKNPMGPNSSPEACDPYAARPAPKVGGRLVWAMV